MAVSSMFGEVVSINIKGRGQNSAQLLFVVRSGTGTTRAFVVTAYPAFEPQVFGAMATVLSTAYALKETVMVTFEEAYPTDLAFEVEIIRIDRAAMPAVAKVPPVID
jgi:hypothetical protein